MTRKKFTKRNKTLANEWRYFEGIEDNDTYATIWTISWQLMRSLTYIFRSCSCMYSFCFRDTPEISLHFALKFIFSLFRNVLVVSMLKDDIQSNADEFIAAVFIHCGGSPLSIVDYPRDDFIFGYWIWILVSNSPWITWLNHIKRNCNFF